MRVRPAQCFSGVSIALVVLIAPSAIAQSFDKLAPYAELRWNADAPEVRIADAWCELLAINDTTAGEIVTFCKKQYGNELWQKRFREDLVQAMTEMGVTPGNKVRLKLRDLESGAEKMLPDVPMTHENRQALRKSANAEATRPMPSAKPASLSPSDVQADLAEFEQALRTQYSYLKLRPVDTERLVADAREKFANGCTPGELAIVLQRVISRFGDGHSRVRQLGRWLPRGSAPCSLVSWSGRIVPLTSDGKALDVDHPILTSIDGKPVARWLDAARPLVADGSPAFVAERLPELLGQIAWLRDELGRPAGDSVEFELSAVDGGDTRMIKLTLADEAPAPPRARYGQTRTLQEGVGYLRIAQMDDAPAFIDQLHADMARFRETRGLIIDVRDNGGGARDALCALLPYFMAADESPAIVNIAAYRLLPGDAADAPEGFLSNRFLFPAESKQWDAAARSAIDAFRARFRPEWQPPAGDFSAWHYMAVERGDDPRTYRYDKPVFVLMNGRCFSATDIFLGALAGRKGVTLMGTPSGGGSGRARELRLTHSGVSLMLSSMASFRPSGELYDNRGVKPDIVAEPTLSDVLGETDSLLAAAVARLK